MGFGALTREIPCHFERPEKRFAVLPITGRASRIKMLIVSPKHRINTTIVQPVSASKTPCADACDTVPTDPGDNFIAQTPTKHRDNPTYLNRQIHSALRGCGWGANGAAQTPNKQRATPLFLAVPVPISVVTLRLLTGPTMCSTTDAVTARDP